METIFVSPAKARQAKADRIERTLRRRFPGLQVQTQIVDYGHGLRVGFFKSFTASFFGRPIGFGFHHGLGTSMANADADALSGKILRTAYPRGWHDAR